jgi:putative ABC transport system substrate-binding protein
MRRRDLLAASVAALFPVAGWAQKVLPAIGFLSSRSPGESAPLVAAFRQGLSEAGYVEGRNLAIEYRWAEGRYDRLPELAADLVARKVEVIAATGGPNSAQAAKRATATIPIVFATGTDPVATGLVASLARPGGNVTGFTIMNVELIPKRLELLGELVPHTKIVALLINPKNPNAESIVRETRGPARAKGMQLDIVRASTEGEIDAAFGALVERHSDALLVAGDPFFASRREQITGLTVRDAIPAIYEFREFAVAGGLASYSPSLAAVYHDVGSYVGRILAGAKPADLPVQEPAKLELVINLKTAKALDLAVPQSILARADEVIE